VTLWTRNSRVRPVSDWDQHDELKIAGLGCATEEKGEGVCEWERDGSVIRATAILGTDIRSAGPVHCVCKGPRRKTGKECKQQERKPIVRV
jgi:hypothetical protein